jgi:hypothetical protein
VRPATPLICAFIDEQKDTYGVAPICRALVVNRPRFYAHLPLREGWRDGDQVRREHQGQGGAVGP